MDADSSSGATKVPICEAYMNGRLNSYSGLL